MNNSLLLSRACAGSEEGARHNMNDGWIIAADTAEIGDWRLEIHSLKSDDRIQKSEVRIS
jgi:hypothetical protein